MRKKKGITYTTLAALFIAIVGFLVIWMVIDVMKTEAEEKTAEELCRLSIATREYTEIQAAKGLVEKKIAPLICPTAESEDVKDMKKEEVKEYLAYKIARCWYKYQEGNVEDVFEGTTFKNECQVCHPLNIKKWKDYKEGDKITNEELIVFMYSNIYKEIEDNDNCKMFGGYCRESCEILSEEKGYEFKTDKDTKCKKDDKVCCYSPYECWNKGGVCSFDKPGEKYLKYDKWDCNEGTCWIKDENYYSYLDYIQRYGGEGRLIILTEDIHPGKSYATSFGSPTKGKGVIFSWMKKGAAAGAVGAVTAIVLGTTPAGWIGMGIYAVGYIVAGTALGAVAGEVNVETHKAIKNLFSERDINTVYLSTYNDAVEKCEVS